MAFFFYFYSLHLYTILYFLKWKKTEFFTLVCKNILKTQILFSPRRLLVSSLQIIEYKFISYISKKSLHRLISNMQQSFDHTANHLAAITQQYETHVHRLG